MENIKKIFDINVLSSAERDVLKLIAVLFMVLDHLAFGLIIPLEIHSFFGRGVFPVFAYGVGIFLASNPRTIWPYVIKLVLFAILSQPIYFILLDMMKATQMLNVLVTLALGAIFARFILVTKLYPQLLHGLLLAMIIMGKIPIYTEYSFAGIVMPALFAFVLQGKKWAWYYLLGCFYILNAPFYDLFNTMWYLAALVSMMFTLGMFIFHYHSASIFTWLFSIKKRFINRYFLYVFYPLHIGVIVLIKIL